MKKSLCILAIILANGCYREEESLRKTNPGFVAFDYSYNVVKEYTTIFDHLYRFNEYCKQPTAEKRDSLDHLYFSNIKITNNASTNIWTLRGLGDYIYLTIQTDGESIEKEGAVWTISDNNYNKQFDVINQGDSILHIAAVASTNVLFACSTEWNLRFKDDDHYELSGNGSLLSIDSPKLKLEYSITEPMIRRLNKANWSVSMIKSTGESGVFKILATDVNKQRTEETNVRILPENHVTIIYNRHLEDWDYDL